ncbi:MAG: RNA-binding protein [Polaromonas sp.]|nr:RNA-binding protein [Polaromonas sp.]
MKDFKLTPDMLTLGGVFYPKGYAFIMFASAQAADRVAGELDGSLGSSADIMRLSPATVLREIGKIDGESDVTLPSVGTEGATVRKYVDLARLGHCALMIHVSSDEDAETVMVSARKADFSYAQRYHLLAIEDLE